MGLKIEVVGSLQVELMQSLCNWNNIENQYDPGKEKYNWEILKVFTFIHQRFLYFRQLWCGTWVYQLIIGILSFSPLSR